MKKILYLYKSGTLKRKDNSLVLENEKIVDYIPIEQIDMIICFSEITLNKRTLSLLNQYQIGIIFFNYYGNYIGRFSPKEYKDGRILVNQVSMYQDNIQRVYIAKSITLASIKNMISVSKYYRKKGKNLDDQIESLNHFVEEIKKVDSIEKLLIIEAQSKQIYYSIFDYVLENEMFHFEKRTKNPPENEVNAMLSYGYSIVYGIILSVLDRSSLFPQVSFIHSLSKNSDSLQFDIADIFKPVLVDRLVLRLIRKKQMNASMFDYNEGKCYLNKLGVKLFCTEFDLVLKSTIDYSGKKFSYKSIISKEIHKLSEYIKGNSNKLSFYTMKW